MSYGSGQELGKCGGQSGLGRSGIHLEDFGASAEELRYRTVTCNLAARFVRRDQVETGQSMVGFDRLKNMLR
jgi:hypothetical protein